ncbi:MAG: MFS transporter [Spirochaetales bacterium]
MSEIRSRLLRAGPLAGIAGETWQFASLMVFFWASVVTLEAFLVPYLTSIGFGSAAAGMVMSSIFLASIVSAPVWGAICDAGDRHRLVMIVALSGSTAAVLLIQLTAPRFLPVILLGIAYSATANSMPGVLDSWIMRRRRVEPRIQYGIARGFGSAGFALGGVVLGRLSDLYSPAVLFPAYAVLATVSIALILRMPRGRDSAEGTDSAASPGATSVETGREQQPVDPYVDIHAEADRPVAAVHQTLSVEIIRAIVRSTPYLVFLMVSLVIFLQLRAALTFLPLLIYETGGSNIHVGLTQTVGAGSEVPFMFATAFLLRKFPPRALLLFGMTVFIFRIGLMGWIDSPQLLVAMQVLHGLSFGVFMPVSIHYIDGIAPRRYATVFQAFAPSFYFGIGSVVGSSLGGLFVERFGLIAMYRTIWIPVTIATAFFAVYLLRGRRSPAS